MLLASPRIRLYLPLILFFTSLTSLLFLFPNSLLSVQRFSRLKSTTSNSTAAFPVDHLAALNRDPPPDKPPFGAVVIASRNTTDLSWTTFIKTDWQLYPYDVDIPDSTDPRLRFPVSKGHEAMVYLSYIIDNYDDLPWGAVFIHGHAEAWHQEEIITRLIKGINLVSLGRAGYFSLRCDWYPSCPAEMQPETHDVAVGGARFNTKATEMALAGNWKLMFPKEKLPRTLASPCCAQFAVTRQAIRKRPKSDYERLRNWLMYSLLDDDISGRVLEKLWAYLFTGNAVHCPPPQQCACDYFVDRCSANNKSSIPPEETKLR